MRKISLALACASMGLIGSVHAASSASASVGNLTFRLIDLNPFDGFDSSFSFVASTNSSTNLQISASEPGASESASKTRPQAFYTKTLTTEDLTRSGATAAVSSAGVSSSGFAEGVDTVFSAQASTGVGSSYVHYGDGILLLSPNSLLIVTAAANVAAKAAVIDSGLNCYYCYDEASASASFSLSYYYGDGLNAVSYRYFDAISTSAIGRGSYDDYSYFDYTTYSWQYHHVPALSENKAESRIFSAVFVNSSDAVQLANLRLSSAVNGVGSTAVPLIGYPPVIAVPEADSVALALAGLGVAGALLRRRRDV